MSETDFLEEDKAILDEYFDKIAEVSGKGLAGVKERDSVYQSAVALICERIQYVRGCDPNNESTEDISHSVINMCSLLLVATTKPENESNDAREMAYMNFNHFLDCLYKKLCDPLQYAFMVSGMVVNLVRRIVGDSAHKPESARELSDLISKAREEGHAIVAYNSEGEKLSDEELDDLVGDWMEAEKNGTH